MNKKAPRPGKNLVSLDHRRWPDHASVPDSEKFFGSPGGAPFFRKRTAFFLTFFAIALFTREPGHLTAPQLWAEDGNIWLHDAYTNGWASLFWPRVGYLQTISRLSALVGVALLPFTAMPLFFAVLAFVIQLAPAALLLSRRGSVLVPSLPARLLLVGFYIAEPNSAEVYVNLTNAMWHLAILAFLLVVLPKPRNTVLLALDILLLILSGLSGPLVLLIAPIACWHAWEQRRQAGKASLIYAGLLTLCALIQAGILTSGAGNHRLPPDLGATFGRLCHILADQIILGGILGGNIVTQMLMQPWWQRALPAAVCCLVALILGLIAFVRGPAAYRQLGVLSVLSLASALKTPIITRAMPQWIPMQSPGIGDRYYIIPMLAWFATLMVLAAEPGLLRWLARGLICLSLVGVVFDWKYPPYVATGYQAAARNFAAAPPNAIMTFPENPPPWSFVLKKK